MTPGFAKTREEMPWLPYRTPDVQVINAHNFPSGGFSPAVNGKMPIAAWIPSLDTAGNGTTTLTDLVGSNNGTLTNMDAATDWVADTDSGGVRALEFDGSNDHVTTLLAGGTRTAITLSIWAKINVSQSNKALFGWWNGGNGIFLQTGISNGTRILALSGAGASYGETPVASFPVSQWHHVLLSYDGSQSTDSQRLVVYINGVPQLLTFALTIPASVALSPGTLTIGDIGSLGRYWPGLIDDARVWDQALDATDAAALATGRGVNVA